jgi:hypothetical protein
VGGVGHVAGQRGDPVGEGERGDGGGQPIAVPGVEDEVPAVRVEGGGEGPAEPA